MKQSVAAGCTTERVRVLAQLVFFSLSFHLVFFASKGTQTIATSVIHGRLPYDALGTLYVAFMLSAVFVTPHLVAKLTAKWSLVAGSLAYLFFSAAFFLPAQATLLPAGAAVGVAAALMWVAKGVYLSSLSQRYAAATHQPPLAAAALLNGVFFATYQLSAVLGNLASSLCLFLAGHTSLFADSGSELIPGRFASGPDMYLYVVFTFVSVLGSAGLFFLPPVASSALSATSTKNPDDSNADDASLATLEDESAAEAGSLVTNHGDGERIPTWRDAGKQERLKQMTAYRRLSGMARLLKKPEMLLLVPFILYTGAQQGFALGDFTRSIIRATAGTEAVGFVVALQSLVAAVSSWLLSKCSDRLGTRPLFAIGFLAYGSFAAFWISFLRVTPLSALVLQRPLLVLFAWAAVLGLGDAAVANVFCNSVLVSLFTTADSVEAAFANLKFWQSLGVALALFLAPVLDLEIKLAALIATLVVGTFGVFLLDRCVRSLNHTALSSAMLVTEDDVYDDDDEQQPLEIVDETIADTLEGEVSTGNSAVIAGS